ncbi:MAG: mechanosensitive ion channel family protein [Microcoleaceae cyanobacterium]
MLAPESLPIELRLIPVGFAMVLVISALPRLTNLVLGIKKSFASSGIWSIFQKTIEPDKDFLQSVSLLLTADLILLITGQLVPQKDFIDIIEFPVGLSTSFLVVWLGYRVLERFFKLYVTKITQGGSKLNKDLLFLTTWINFSLFLFIIVVIFSNVHAINIFGLFASVGVGSVAIAFAAQKTLEQLLGGVVIYLDRPFVLDDYISLPDGTFGKVESIGLRSTRIRTSGKGTLMAVPNNYLTSINVENFTEASKLINVIKINFSERLGENREAFVRQLILDSSISAEIERRSISVIFQNIINESGHEITQGQVKYFIQAAGELSKEFRILIISIVGENIRQKLLDHGIDHEVSDRIWIDSNISI